MTERLLWDDYQAAYQRVFDETSTTDAPWFVVPADRKWYARLAVQHLLIDALNSIDPQWPAARLRHRAREGAAGGELS